MFKNKVALAAGVMASLLFFTACNNIQAAVDEEIKIPIYESVKKTFDNTASALYMNLTKTEAIPAVVGYFYADEVRSYVGGDANLLEWNATVNGKFNEGDVLAVLDSSSLTYDYNNQKILTDSAEQRYLGTRNEADRLEYLIRQKELELITEKIDEYTIKAPYDCVVVSMERYKTGDVIQKGNVLFSIAHTEDVYIYCTQNSGLFYLGSDVTVRLNNTDYYGKVVSGPVSVPANAGRDIKNAAIIKMNGGELKRLLTDTPNAVTAGWATVYLKTAEKHNVLAVPDGAVKNYNGKIYCNVVQDNETVQVNVETGQSINGFTVILSGLSEGDILSVT